jgi:hypothetical protein
MPKARADPWPASRNDPTGNGAPVTATLTAASTHVTSRARSTRSARWLDEATAGLVTGQYVDPRAGRVTFREYAEQWRAAAPHGPAMRDKVARALERHVYPAMGEWPISAIRPSALQAWVTGLPLAPSTAKVTLNYVGGIL